MSLVKMVDRKNVMPDRLDPMLCTLVKEPPISEDYLYEIKWDGYRIISYVTNGKVKMLSRGGLNYTKKYPPIEKALSELGHEVIIDGEVVVFNSDGKPDFNSVQLYNGHDTPIFYCVFDLLWLNGNDLMNMPLTKRKELLKALVTGHKVFKFSESFENGAELYQQAIDLELEGIVAKKKESTYHPDARSYDWVKVPTKIRQEFVIGAWVESEASRAFKSLLFGAYENGQLKWIGRSGGGFKDKEMPGILSQLKEIEIPKSPFVNKILDTPESAIHYVKPELIANFEFATWTKSGRIRKPATFLGFRHDKDPKDVVIEVPAPTPTPAEKPELKPLNHIQDFYDLFDPDKQK